MVSLQEQLLKAGLVDKNKVKKVNQDKSKQKKVERRTGEQTVNEARLAALETQRKNSERARELNAQRDDAARQKAAMAQIAQMVEKNRQSKGGGDIAYTVRSGRLSAADNAARTEGSWAIADGRALFGS